MGDNTWSSSLRPPWEVPLFLDKPLDITTDDARKIIELANETSTPIMSASSLRYAAGIAELTTGGGSRPIVRGLRTGSPPRRLPRPLLVWGPQCRGVGLQDGAWLPESPLHRVS